MYAQAAGMNANASSAMKMRLLGLRDTHALQARTSQSVINNEKDTVMIERYVRSAGTNAPKRHQPKKKDC